MKFLTKYIDNTKENSIANKWRKKRFAIFEELIKSLPKPLKILDAGGTQDFWIQMDFIKPEDASITIVNTDKTEVTLPNFSFIKGDARDLSMFGDNSFDIVFSNSVIEHVGDYEQQRKMADEIKRVGKSYFIQTPNYYFPVEPHFLFPFFQFLPNSIKIFLVMNFPLGWYEKCKTKSEAKELIDSIHLLKKHTFTSLFPTGKLYKEKFLWFTKSFILLKK